MQYLLSEEEMAEIRRERVRARDLPTLEALTNVVRHVATTRVTTVDLNGRGAGATQPHGCIHVPDPRGRQYQTQYCDGCHVVGICPQDKDYSK